MTNPASMLRLLLITWSVPNGKTPEEVRALTAEGYDISTHEFWVVQTTAVAYLREIEQALDGMAANGEDVSHFQEALPRWYQGVFGYRTPWQARTTGGAAKLAIAKADDNLLRALSSYLDLTKYVPSVSNDEAAELRAAFYDVRSLIVDSQDIGDEVRRYLFGLVNAAILCVDELDVFGNVKLRSATFELGGALTSVAETVVAPAGNARAWTESAKRLVGLFGRTVGQKVLDSASDGTAGAITDATNGLLGG